MSERWLPYFKRRHSMQTYYYCILFFRVSAHKGTNVSRPAVVIMEVQVYSIVSSSLYNLHSVYTATFFSRHIPTGPHNPSIHHAYKKWPPMRSSRHTETRWVTSGLPGQTTCLVCSVRDGSGISWLSEFVYLCHTWTWAWCRPSELAVPRK